MLQNWVSGSTIPSVRSQTNSLKHPLFFFLMEKPTVSCQWQPICFQNRTKPLQTTTSFWHRHPSWRNSILSPTSGKSHEKILTIEKAAGKTAPCAPCTGCAGSQPTLPSPMPGMEWHEGEHSTWPQTCCPRASFRASTEYPGCAFQEHCLNKEKAPELLSLFPIHDSKRLVENWFRNNPLVPPTHITERFLQQMYRKSPTSANGATIPRTSSFGYSFITWKPRCFYFPYCTECNFFFKMSL